MQTQPFTSEHVFTQIKEAIAVQTGIETGITPETQLAADLEIDSLGLVDLAIQIERAYDLVLDEKQVRRCVTLQDLIDLVLRSKNA